MPDEEKLVCNIEENKRKVFIVINQIVQLEALLFGVQAAFDARRLIDSYNAILETCRDVFHCDDMFMKSIRHLQPHKAENIGGPVENRNQHVAVIGSVVLDLAMLKGAVLSFFQVYMTEEEKDTLAFGFEVKDKK